MGPPAFRTTGSALPSSSTPLCVMPSMSNFVPWKLKGTWVGMKGVPFMAATLFSAQVVKKPSHPGPSETE